MVKQDFFHRLMIFVVQNKIICTLNCAKLCMKIEVLVQERKKRK